MSRLPYLCMSKENLKNVNFWDLDLEAGSRWQVFVEVCDSCPALKPGSVFNTSALIFLSHCDSGFSVSLCTSGEEREKQAFIFQRTVERLFIIWPCFKKKMHFWVWQTSLLQKHLELSWVKMFLKHWVRLTVSLCPPPPNRAACCDLQACRAV